MKYLQPILCSIGAAAFIGWQLRLAYLGVQRALAALLTGVV